MGPSILPAYDGQMSRYRCAACGNLTRFDVVVTRRLKAYYHFTVGGDLNLEDEEILDEVFDEVTCRWCGSSKAIEVIELEAVELEAVELDAVELDAVEQESTG